MLLPPNPTSRTVRPLLTGAAAGALLACGVFAPAVAQMASQTAASPDGEPEVIIVTAQKREQRILDVPVAVTAYGGATLQQLGIEQFDDLALFVPGLEVQEQSPNNPGFVIRGITSDDGSSVVEARVSVFQDGVSITRSRGSYVELHDMERIEVVKGPQSTLFGRGALIGAISLIQAKADTDEGFGGSAALGAGNLSQLSARGAVTIPLVSDVLAVRVAGIVKQRDGYVDNALGGEAFMSQDVQAWRLSLAWTPSQATRADLIVNWQRDQPSGTSFKSGAYAPPGGTTAPWTAAALSRFTDAVGSRFEGGRDLGLDRTVEGVTLLVRHDISDSLTLNSITGWRQFKSLEIFDPDGFAPQVLLFAEDAQGDQISQEFRLNWTPQGNLSGFAGIGIFREDGFQRVPLQYDERGTLALFGALTSGRPVTALFAPAQFPNFPSNAVLGSILTTPTRLPFKPIHVEEFQNFGVTQAFDIFGDLTWAVTDRLELSGGLRLTQEAKTSGYLGRLLNGPSSITGGGLFANLTPGGARLEGSRRYEGETWRLVARYELSDSWNAYGSVARGRRSDVLAYNTASRLFETIPAEIATSTELGLKGTAFSGALQLETALFRYEYENFQTSVRDGVTVRTINAGNATTTGFEMAAQLRLIPDRLRALITFSQTKGRFDDTDSGGRPQVFAGNSFRLSPDQTGSLALIADFGGPWGSLTVTPSYTWQSEVFFDNDNRPDKSQDGYGLVGLSARYGLPGPVAGMDLAVELSGTNLLDEDYIIDAGNTGDVFGIPTFIAGPPRLWRVQLMAEF
jgi:outer membrane receptor protein involved in Fe transport